MSTSLGKRIDLHTHSLLSDGMLLPAEVLRYACSMDFAAIAITDHVDYSNMVSVIKDLAVFAKKQAKFSNIVFVPGVEITHADPALIASMAKEARKLGAKIIVCHGQTPSEPVAEGTNRAAVLQKGLVDILAHPGYISEEDAVKAKENGIYLELSAKPAHKETNKHVAKVALKTGAKMLINTDAHGPSDYITQEKAFELAMESGLNETDAIRAVKDNPRELLARLGIKVI
ncbi:MAG: histidinol phosphate phosphatase domain-containing protein [Candidatus Margulisiibacteriota bacterium]